MSAPLPSEADIDRAARERGWATSWERSATAPGVRRLTIDTGEATVLLIGPTSERVCAEAADVLARLAAT